MTTQQYIAVDDKTLDDRQFLIALLDFVKGNGEHPPSLWRVEEILNARLKPNTMTLNEFIEAVAEYPGDAQLKVSTRVGDHETDVDVTNVCQVCPDGPDCEAAFIRITIL